MAAVAAQNLNQDIEHDDRTENYVGSTVAFFAGTILNQIRSISAIDFTDRPDQRSANHGRIGEGEVLGRPILRHLR